MAQNYQLAEINVARMKGVSINDPIMSEFVDNLERVNTLAENSAGFVWRLKDEVSGNATSINPFDDEQVIVNISVWKNIETFEDFVYKTFHTDFLKRRREWFHTFGKVATAMWWIPEGAFPSAKDAANKLIELQNNGATQAVFDFKNKFEQPS